MYRSGTFSLHYIILWPAFSQCFSHPSNPCVTPPYFWMILAPFAPCHSFHYSCHNFSTRIDDDFPTIWLLSFLNSPALQPSLLKFFSTPIISTLLNFSCMHPTLITLPWSSALPTLVSQPQQFFCSHPVYNPLIPLLPKKWVCLLAGVEPKDTTKPKSGRRKDLLLAAS